MCVGGCVILEVGSKLTTHGRQGGEVGNDIIFLHRFFDAPNNGFLVPSSSFQGMIFNYKRHIDYCLEYRVCYLRSHRGLKQFGHILCAGNTSVGFFR